MNTNQIRNNAKARGNGHGGSSQDATQKIVPTKPGRESSSSSDRNRAKTGKIKTPEIVRLRTNGTNTHQDARNDVYVRTGPDPSRTRSNVADSSNLNQMILRSGKVYPTTQTNSYPDVQTLHPVHHLERENSQFIDELAQSESPEDVHLGTSSPTPFLPSKHLMSTPKEVRVPSLVISPVSLDRTPSVVTALHSSTPSNVDTVITRTVNSPSPPTPNGENSKSLLGDSLDIDFDVSLGLNLSNRLFTSVGDTNHVNDSVEVEIGCSIDPNDFLLSQSEFDCQKELADEISIGSSILDDTPCSFSNILNGPPLTQSETISSIRPCRVVIEDICKTPDTVHEENCGRTKTFKEKKPSQEKTHSCNSNLTVASPPVSQADANGCSLLPTQDSSNSQKRTYICSRSKTPSGDYSADANYMNGITERLPVKWPGVNEREKWNLLDKSVEKKLPKSHEKALNRLNQLEDSIYKVGVELFGVIDRRTNKSKTKGSSRRTRECVSLVIQKNSLIGSIESASCKDDRDSFSEVLTLVQTKLRKLRRAEKKLKNKCSFTKSARNFYSNPYKTGKEILNPSSTTRLTFDKEALDASRQKTLSDQLASIPLDSLEGLPPPPKITSSLSGGPFTWPEFQALLKTRRNSSAPGLNSIPYKVYKCCELLARYLLNILRCVLNTQDIPVQWRCDKIIFIPKVPNPSGTDLKEYRELALGNVEGKLFFSLVSNRLTRHIVDKYKCVNTSVQKGCMKGIPGCWEHMASVWEALTDAKLNKKNIATVWLDLANAYGTIPHQLILFALERYQVHDKLFNIVRNYYAGLWSKSFVQTAPSSWHQHQRGIFTGCTVSIILFVSAINVVIEYILANDIQGYKTHKGIALPPVRAFMDDMNLMSNSVENTKTLLDRSCSALKWARMEFRPDKSRCIVVEKGSVLPTTPFSTNTDSSNLKSVSIPSIHSNPIKFLGRIVDGALNDKKSVSEIQDKLASGLKKISNSKLGGKAKVWVLSNLLIPQIRWPLMIYEVPVSTGIVLEQRISFFLRKWLRLPRSVTDVALYSKTSPCSLPLVSLTSVLRNSKVSAFLQLRESKDALVSTLGPKLRAGNLDIEKEVTTAEAEIKFREMVGIPVSSEPPQVGARHISTSKPGLGLKGKIKLPKKHTKEYRKAVTKVLGDLQEERYVSKAVGSLVQCHWTRWVNYIHNDFSWHKLIKMPPSLLSFCLNSTFDTLPTPRNLLRWKVRDADGSCALCPEKICTTTHILGTCPKALEQDRFTWRHDSVLYEIINQIHSVGSAIGRESSSTAKSQIFVKEGTRVKRKTRKVVAPSGILSKASDWKLRADFKNMSTVPVFLTPTTLRPDLVIYSKAISRVIIIELTCPCEQNFTKQHAKKTAKYCDDMVPAIVKNGWHVDFFAVEVGARGYCSTSLRSCLLSLGFSRKRASGALQKIGRISLERSFHIWLCRNTLEWTFEEKHPWHGFQNPLEISKPIPPTKSSVSKDTKSLGTPQQSQNPTSEPLESRQRKVVELSNEWYSNFSAPPTKPSASSSKSVPINPVPKKPSYPSPSNQRVIVVKAKLPFGLKNHNKCTCYLNSLLQALLDVSDFWKPFASSRRQEIVPPLVRNFLDVLSSMKRHNEGKRVLNGKLDDVGVNTSQLLRKIQKAKIDAGDPLFRWNCQNDAAEILSTLIEELRKTFVQWNVSCIKTRALTQCTECSSERLEEDVDNPYLILSPKGKLVESLHKYMLPELIKGQICESCESTKASKCHAITMAPKILVIQIDRGLDYGSINKNLTVVDVSSQTLDLPTRKNGSLVHVRYCLKSVVCHEGRTSANGHYFTYSKRGQNWYMLSDAKVRQLAKNLVTDSINTKYAYMYVFEKSVDQPV